MSARVQKRHVNIDQLPASVYVEIARDPEGFTRRCGEFVERQEAAEKGIVLCTRSLAHKGGVGGMAGVGPIPLRSVPAPSLFFLLRRGVAGAAQLQSRRTPSSAQVRRTLCFTLDCRHGLPSWDGDVAGGLHP